MVLTPSDCPCSIIVWDSLHDAGKATFELTPLHLAAARGHAEACKELLMEGADPSRSIAGWGGVAQWNSTPKHLASDVEVQELFEQSPRFLRLRRNLATVTGVAKTGRAFATLRQQAAERVYAPGGVGFRAAQREAVEMGLGA